MALPIENIRKSTIFLLTILDRHSRNYQVKKKGGQTSLSEEEEEAILVDRIKICSNWGYPLDSLTLRLLVKDFLERPGRGEASVPKYKFPVLLKQLCDSLKEDNFVSGFRKCGIVPLDRNKVLNTLPKTDCNAGTSNSSNETSVRVEAIGKTFKELLATLRQCQAKEKTSKDKYQEKVSR